MNPLFTIGHSNHAIGTFLGLLAGHEIAMVADVRSIPWSQRFPWFRKELIAWSLKEAKIGYEFLGETLGGRPRDLADLDHAAERYGVIVGQASFQGALDALVKEAVDHRVAIMCAERDPIDCHRAMLIARALRGRDGLEIRHILAAGELEPHGDLEARMVEKAKCAPPPLLDTPDMQQRAREEAYDILAHGPGWRPSG